LLEKIGGLGILVEVAGLVLLNPHPDQVPADVMALGKPMKGLANRELWTTWRLNSMLCVRCLVMGFSSFESPVRGSIPDRPTVRPKGPTPRPGQFSVEISTVRMPDSD